MSHAKGQILQRFDRMARNALRAIDVRAVLDGAFEQIGSPLLPGPCQILFVSTAASHMPSSNISNRPAI